MKKYCIISMALAFMSLKIQAKSNNEYIAVYKTKTDAQTADYIPGLNIQRYFGPNKRFVLINSSKSKQTIKELLKNSDGFMHLSKNEKISLLPLPKIPQIKNTINGKHSRTPFNNGLWWQEKINLSAAHEINSGSPEIIVGVIDTGVDYLHDDLKNNIFFNSAEIPGNGIDDDNNGKIDDYYGFNFFSNFGSGMDDNGHGTHCAGIISANGALKGVAPNVKIMPLKFLNNYGSGDIAKAIDAITYAVDMGAQILTNSYGNPNSNEAFLEAVRYAKDNEVLFFAAAGNAKNDNDQRGEYPANYHLENVVSVAASNSAELKASFSNFGQISVDLFAPGESIYSLDVNNRYKVRSGTSMATPMAAGVAALIWSEYPEIEFTQVLSILSMTSFKSQKYFPLSQTPGRIDAYKALTKQTSPNQYPFPRSSIAEIPFSLQSESPYQSNTSTPYPIKIPDAKMISVHFEQIDIENGYDYLQIETQEGRILKKITGEMNTGYSEFFDGNSIILKIVSDSTEQRAGFKVDKLKIISID